MSALAPSPAQAQQIDFLLVLFRPLLTVDETRFLLGDPSAQVVTRRLEDGTLRGVDISADWPAAGRRELRLYRYSVEHLFFAPGKRLVRVPVEQIFPHRRDVFRRDEVAQLLNCTSRHVSNLGLPGPRLSSAANPASVERCPRVFRQGLIEFLNAREVKP